MQAMAKEYTLVPTDFAQKISARLAHATGLATERKSKFAKQKCAAQAIFSLILTEIMDFVLQLSVEVGNYFKA